MEVLISADLLCEATKDAYARGFEAGARSDRETLISYIQGRIDYAKNQCGRATAFAVVGALAGMLSPTALSTLPMPTPQESKP